MAGTVVVAVILVLALNASALISRVTDRRLTADFAEAGGLVPGDDVRVAGTKVGSVGEIELSGSAVLVHFQVGRSVQLGSGTSASIKTYTVLGRKYLALTSAGSGRLSGDEPIPLGRTTPAYDLTRILADLTSTSSALDTTRLAEELRTLSSTFADTPEDFAAALTGVSALSRTIAGRDRELRELFAGTAAISSVLAERRQQVQKLIVDGDTIVEAVLAQRAAVDQLFLNVSELARQVEALVEDGQTHLRPALVELRQLLAVVNRNRADIQKTLRTVSPFARSLGEAVGNGPLFLAYIGNLTPPGWVENAPAGGSR